MWEGALGWWPAAGAKDDMQADPIRGGHWRVGPHTGFPEALEQLLSLRGPLLGARTPSPVPLQAPGHVLRMSFTLRLPESLCSGLAHLASLQSYLSSRAPSFSASSPAFVELCRHKGAVLPND